ncbi:MAG TPA: GH1 family beta-glucosidase [Planktothrix sp.]|jgi:beta-glucosidase
MSVENYVFPRGFIWGAATAAYQIEGAADIDGRGPSIWDTFSHTPGKTLNGDTGDIGCDHYHHYGEDFELLKQIGASAYRFSVSWPRVLPQGKGKANIAGLDFYDRLVDTLCDLNIEPFVTLYHWDLPQALQDIGGWGNRDVAGYFADYSAMVVRRLGDRVKRWITINEPWVVAVIGNLLGKHAPGLHDHKLAAQVGHHLLVAHGMSMQAIRSIQSNAEVGIALSMVPTEPIDDSEAAHKAARNVWDRDGAWFLDPLLKGHYPPGPYQSMGDAAPKSQPNDFALISQGMDFLGINYYTRNLVTAKGELNKPASSEYTEMGWEICPEALGRLLIKLDREYTQLPTIFITENGCAVPDILTPEQHVHDHRRIKFLHDHLVEVRRAIKEGVRVKGYFVWSLLDNFEWEHGYSKRFGLTYVDYETKARILKDSAYWYGKVIRRNEVHR